VLILNWNGRQWLRQCVDAVLRQDPAPAEVWVVDNGSSDGSGEMAGAWPNVRWLQLNSNVGFGAAYNRAIGQCRRDVVVLLNNDTLVQPGWLAELTCELDRHPEAAAAGSKLLFLDRPDVLNHGGGQITSLGAAYDVDWGARDPAGERPSRACSMASGAALALRREAFLDVAGFDESYFAYFEDADLCWRLWLKGYTVRYVPAARVLHAYGGSTGEGRHSAFRIRHCQTNRLQNMAKNLELGTLSRLWPASLAYDAARLGTLRRGGQAAAVRAYVQGTLCFWQLLPHVLEQRRRAQATRRRSDAELFRLGVLAGLGQAAAEWRRLGSLRSQWGRFAPSEE